MDRWTPPAAQHRRGHRTAVYKELSHNKGTLSASGHTTDSVMWIELPSDRKDFTNEGSFSDQAVWVKAGVAAVCRLHPSN
jgi:hypothetical protein